MLLGVNFHISLCQILQSGRRLKVVDILKIIFINYYLLNKVTEL